MSDFELEMIKYRKMMELRRQIEKKRTEGEGPRETSPREILDGFFADRAWEVFNAAKHQYPEVADYVERVLVKLILEGKIREKISGKELYGIFLRLGCRVRLPTRISIIEDGKVKSLEQKIREATNE